MRTKLKAMMCAVLFSTGCGGTFSYVKDVQPTDDGALQVERCNTSVVPLGWLGIKVTTGCRHETVKKKPPEKSDG